MFKDFYNRNTAKKSQANYVEYGFGQVEPNHLSAQKTGQIYAQLPAKSTIDILENGQFVKYDYAANGNGIGEVNFTGEGEWMLVYNEIKLYRNHFDGTKQWDCEFAMLKDDYGARIYSPYDWERPAKEFQARYYNGKDSAGNTSITVETNVDASHSGTYVTIQDKEYPIVSGLVITDTPAQGDTEAVTHTAAQGFTYNGVNYELINGKAVVPVTYNYDSVTTSVRDIYELNWTSNPYTQLGLEHEKKMPAGTSMVPRVYKTNVGDIFTTNMIKISGTGSAEATEAQILAAIQPGVKLVPNADGILAPKTTPVAGDMVWKIGRVYTMPDGQRGVKIVRIA